MSITWSLSRNGVKIPSEEGKTLCSTIDPYREAQQWVQYWSPAINWCDRFIVIGGGSGVHLSALSSEKLFGVVEFRELPLSVLRVARSMEEVKKFRSEIEENQNLRWGIFDFKPSWQNRSHEFKSARSILLGNQPDSALFQSICEELFV